MERIPEANPIKKMSFQEKLMKIKESLAGPQFIKEVENVMKIQRWFRQRLIIIKIKSELNKKYKVTAKIPIDSNVVLKENIATESHNANNENIEIVKDSPNDEQKTKSNSENQLAVFLQKLVENSNSDKTSEIIQSSLPIEIQPIQEVTESEISSVDSRMEPEKSIEVLSEDKKDEVPIRTEAEPIFEKLANYLQDVVQDPIPETEKVQPPMESVELLEAYRTIEALKKALDQERSKSTFRINSLNEDKSQCLMKQKEEFEHMSERQLAFIDQLVKDKKELTNLVETLKEKLKDNDQKYGKKHKEAEETYSIELKKNKETWMAAEKLRREKWEKEKIQEIKLNTTKALQPELVNLMQKHQSQIKDIENQLEIKWKKDKEGILLEYENKIKIMKNEHKKELEEMLENERENYSAKLKQENEKFEKEQETLKMKIRWE